MQILIKKPASHAYYYTALQYYRAPRKVLFWVWGASRKQRRMVLASQDVRKSDFLTLLIYILLLSKLLTFLHSKSNMKRILPSLPFLPVGLNDAVKILFYYKSFHWMTPWHYRTLERKGNVNTTDLEKIFSFIYSTNIWELIMFQTLY